MKPLFAQSVTNIDYSQLGPVAGTIIAMCVAVILALAGVIVYLYKTGQTREKAYQVKVDEKQARIDELQEKRVAEAEKRVDNVALPLSKIADQQQVLYDRSIISANKSGA